MGWSALVAATRVLSSTPPAAHASLPAVQGDVAQVADLPAGVAEAFGINVTQSRVTRDHAMRVPSVRRARAIICPTVGGMPLRAMRLPAAANGRPAPTSPDSTPVFRQMLARPEPDTVRSSTLTWTVDSLLFHGVAWWYVTGRDAQGFPLEVERVDVSRVQVDAAERVQIDGVLVRDEDVIRFDAPDEGVLNTSAELLCTALDLLRTTRVMSQPTAPLTVLRDLRTDGEPVSREDADGILDDWERNRRRRALAWVPANVGVEHPDWDPAKLGLSESREQTAIDVARAFNLPASWLAAPDGGSLTYRNARDLRTDLVGLTLAPFMTAITERLSMPDVTPRGQVVEFDTSGFLAGSRRDRIDDAAAAVGAGLMSVDEARREFLQLPPAEAAPAPVAPPAPPEEAS
ncbi:phage portal protein [Jannaschia sp. R86511]|uniref:phage portal protein n=1 Tax=Jannaschia sp. R86511 TaxID=3093853 RepID=UPI0036D32792